MNCRITLLALAAALVSLEAGFAFSGEVPSSEQAHVIQVEGHGDTRTSPDIAMLTMTIGSNAATADLATSLNAATTKRVLDAVNSKLAGKGRVDTAGYSLNPVYSNTPGGFRASSYHCFTRYTIQTDSKDLVPDLLDTIRAASGGAITPQANSQGPNQPFEVQFAAEGRAFTAGDCKKTNATLIQKVMGPLKAKLGSHDRLEEAGISIDPDAPSNSPNNPELIGYRAENSLVVETSAFDQIGPCIDTAVAAGATQLGQLSFALRDTAKARSDALVAASNDAQLRAQTVARAMGVKIKRILKILVTGEIQPQPYSGSFMAGSLSLQQSSAPTPIKPGQITVPATITVLYELE